MLKTGLNKFLCKYSETLFKIAFAVFFGACILFMWKFSEGQKQVIDAEAIHHEEVKSLVQESIEKQQVTEVKVDKLDKKVDKVSSDIKIGHTKYLKDLSLINRTLKNNAASYDKTYALMDTTDVAAVNSFNAKWLSKADSIDEW